MDQASSTGTTSSTLDRAQLTADLLQTYRDAADQASLSRVWGGANAPFDDIPGRRLGMEVGTAAFRQAAGYFYKDADRDGVLRFEDCDDTNAAVYPGAPELCDGLDNDCNGKVDDVTPPCTGGQ